MKNLLVGINAKYIHSNLAIRYIQKYSKKQGVVTHIREYTINQSVDYILDEIIQVEADVIAFSCYLWNITYIKMLVRNIKRIRQDIKIILGGPEVSYNPKEWLEEIWEVDYIISGEGEVVATALLQHINQGLSVESLKGIAYRDGHNLIQNRQGKGMDMADVPFVYHKGLDGLENRIIYYETSRGCPYSCQFCLSSIEKGVRFRPLELVLPELQFFLDERVVQVKFIDRTFNARRKHAMAIWTYLRDHDNGYTNFHFEITADLIDDDTVVFLKTLRKGLLQFEIGVQSTNEATIIDVERKTDFEKLKRQVLTIKEGHNIHLHLDLIAGLPKEDYHSFRQSFNDVMALRPDQLQLGFLKVLKGSKIHLLQEHYGIICRDYAPYEVLMTKEMSYNDLMKLKRLEDILEIYYNSGQFPYSISYLMRCHRNEFEFFEAFAGYWKEQGWFHVKHKKIRFYEFILEYSQGHEQINIEFLKELIVHDLCLLEKPKKWPTFVIKKEETVKKIKEFYQSNSHQGNLLEAYSDYTSKQISRMAHIEIYNYNIVKYIESGFEEIVKVTTTLFYDYKQKDCMTGYAKITEIKQ